MDWKNKLVVRLHAISRMVSNDELNMSYNYDVENEKASYLRRKIERGKSF